MNITDEEIKKYTLKELSQAIGIDAGTINKLFTIEKGMPYVNYRSKLINTNSSGVIGSINSPSNKDTRRERLIDYSIKECKITFIGNYSDSEKIDKAKKILAKQEEEVKLIEEILEMKKKFINYIKERI